MAGQIKKGIVKILTTDTWANLLNKLKKSELGNVLNGKRLALNDNGTICEIPLVEESGSFTIVSSGDWANSPWSFTFKKINGYVIITTAARIDTVQSGGTKQTITFTPSAGFANMIPSAGNCSFSIPILINAQPEMLNIEVSTAGTWGLKKSGGNWSNGQTIVIERGIVGIYELN